jgi:hypothetical protein
MSRAPRAREDSRQAGDGTGGLTDVAPDGRPAAASSRARQIPRPPDWTILAGLTAVITALDVLWRLEEKRPPHWDMAHHLLDSLVYRHLFSLSHPLRFVDTYRYYPPLVSWVTDAFYAALANEAIWVAVLSNVVFIAILVFATYGIGKMLWNPWVGLLSALFVVTTPMLVTAFKEYMLDAPLTAMVTLAIYLLLRSDGFSSLRYSVLFGAVCGLGALTKWTFPFAVALPVAVSAGFAIARSISERSLSRVRKLALAALVALLVAEPWYFPNRTVIWHSLRYNGGEAGVLRGSPPVASVASVVWYFWNLVANQLYLVPFLFLLAGVVFLFLNRDFRRRNLVPTLTIVGTYIGFTLLRNKDARFTDPMLPAVAILATSWLAYIPLRARTALAAAIVAYGVAAFLAISFGTSLLPRNLTVHLGSSALAGNIPLLDSGEVTLFAQHGYIFGPPTSENWHQEDLFKTIATAPPSERRFVFTGADTIWFNSWGTRYYALRYGARWVSRLDLASFLIVRGSRSAAIPASFVRIRSYTLPDGEALALYRRA